MIYWYSLRLLAITYIFTVLLLISSIFEAISYQNSSYLFINFITMQIWTTGTIISFHYRWVIIEGFFISILYSVFCHLSILLSETKNQTVYKKFLLDFIFCFIAFSILFLNFYDQQKLCSSFFLIIETPVLLIIFFYAYSQILKFKELPLIINNSFIV